MLLYKGFNVSILVLVFVTRFSLGKQSSRKKNQLVLDRASQKEGQDEETKRTHHQPIHALIDTTAINSRASHDAPVAISQLPQAKRFGNLARTLGARLVLFIRKDEQRSVLELFLV